MAQFWNLSMRRLKYMDPDPVNMEFDILEKDSMQFSIPMYFFLNTIKYIP